MSEATSGDFSAWKHPHVAALMRATKTYADRFRAVFRFVERLVALRLRVAAAFFAERERAAAGRLAEALPPRGPPMRPPFLAETLVSRTPRPEPLLLPPPVSLFTVAQAR